MMRSILLATILSILFFTACGGKTPKGDFLPDVPTSRTFYVVEVLDGEWGEDRIKFAMPGMLIGGVPITQIDAHDTAPEPRNSESIQMVLAFQLAPGKTREDFMAVKAMDLEWVEENNGSNPATIWTERTPEWPYDAFEDISFASREDFVRAYLGNPELNAALDGLFDEQLLVAIVVE